MNDEGEPADFILFMLAIGIWLAVIVVYSAHNAGCELTLANGINCPF